MLMLDTPLDEAPDIGSAELGPEVADAAAARHVREGRGSREALVTIDSDGDRRAIPYSRLAERAADVAAALAVLGIGAGDRVLTLLPRGWELHATMLGSLAAGAGFSALTRIPRLPLSDASPGARALVTTADLLAPCATAIDASGLPVELLLAGPGAEGIPGARSLTSLLASVVSSPAAVGITSTPSRVAGLRPEDVVWRPGGERGRPADPVADLPALVSGATLISDEGDLNVDRWYSVVEDERVTVWCLTAEDLRWLRWAGAGFAESHRLWSLRRIIVLGEDPAPRDRIWATQALGAPVRLGRLTHPWWAA